MVNPFKFPISASKLLPHKRPMLLLDKLVFCSTNSATGVTIIKQNNIFLLSNNIEEIIFIELMAQTYGAFQGYLALKNNLPIPEGFLVGVQDIQIKGQATCGDTLKVEVKHITSFHQFSLVLGKVFKNTKIIACGKIKLWAKN